MKKYLLLNILFVILNIYNTNAQAQDFYSKALEYKKIDNYTEAYKNISKALELEPNNIIYKKELAFIQYKRKAVGEAIKLYEEFIANGENNHENNMRIMELYAYSNKHQQVLEYGKKINEKDLLDSEKLTFYTQMGDEQNRVFFFPQAIEYWKKALKVNPNKPDLNYKVGGALSELTLYKESLVYYENAFKTDSNNANKLFEAAMVCEDANLKHQALHYLLKSEEKGHAKDVALNYEIANVYYSLGDYINAVAYLDKARAISPYDQDVASLTAYSYYNKGDNAEARRVIKAMMDINPSNGDLVYLLGMTYQKEGNSDKAIDLFEKAFKLKPELQRLKVAKNNF